MERKTRQRNKIEKKLVYYGSIEGYQENWYFDFLKNLINHHPDNKRKVNFKFDNAKGGDQLEVCNRVRCSLNLLDNTTIKQLKSAKRVVTIFDYDFKNQQFIEATEFNKSNNIITYYCNVKFELWLLLHFTSNIKSISKIKSDGNYYQEELKKILGFKNLDLKNKEDFSKVMEKITLENILTVISNAKKINASNEKNQTELICPGIYTNPSLNINELIEQILKETGLIK
jgi:hypothetical protein